MGTAKDGMNDEDLLEIAKLNFNFRPYAMIAELNMRKPQFYHAAKFGHFGHANCNFAWETPKKLEYEDNSLF
jgi:S-adenosylmethionine synthetase